MASLEEGPSPLALAKGLVDLGAEMRRSGERAASRQLLERAYSLANSCGSRRVANDARSELRSSGGRLRTTRGEGVTSLTPSERRVADLAAAGNTNREIAEQLFLSEKTVESHMGSVFRKLDIRKRAVLASALDAPAESS